MSTWRAKNLELDTGGLALIIVSHSTRIVHVYCVINVCFVVGTDTIRIDTAYGGRQYSHCRGGRRRK